MNELIKYFNEEYSKEYGKVSYPRTTLQIYRVYQAIKSYGINDDKLVELLHNVKLPKPKNTEEWELYVYCLYNMDDSESERKIKDISNKLEILPVKNTHQVIRDGVPVSQQNITLDGNNYKAYIFNDEQITIPDSLVLEDFENKFLAIASHSKGVLNAVISYNDGVNDITKEIELTRDENFTSNYFDYSDYTESSILNITFGFDYGINKFFIYVYYMKQPMKSPIFYEVKKVSLSYSYITNLLDDDYLKSIDYSKINNVPYKLTALVEGSTKTLKTGEYASLFDNLFIWDANKINERLDSTSGVKKNDYYAHNIQVKQKDSEGIGYGQYIPSTYMSEYKLFIKAGPDVIVKVYQHKTKQLLNEIKDFYIGEYKEIIVRDGLNGSDGIFIAFTLKDDVTDFYANTYVSDLVLCKSDGFLTKQEVDNKVDKINGKGLSTIDFTTAYETKLKKLENYNDTTIKKDIQTINTQLGDIANKLKLVAGDNNTIKLMFGDKELSSITINGGTIEKPVYGNIIFDKNFVKIGENGTGKIGIKLDKKPTQTQTISISEDSDILSVDKTSLTFTSNNYDTYQYITITVGNIDTSETVNIKFINSDELLTESNASIYVVADGDEYNVDTTFPTGAYTVTSADFTDNTVNGDYVILGAYSGTKSNIIVPATMEVDGATKKVMLKSATFSTNTTIQYIQIDSATVINMHGTINQIATSSLNSAFAKCTSLIGFKYDCNRVDNISNTWSGCSKLKFVVGLDNYVKCSNMSQAFMNCSELEYIQDLSKLTLCTNLAQTFNGCTKLKKIYGLPSGATNMNMALYKCAVLENIVIPKNVTDLFYCFSGNTSLKKIEILSEGVTRADQMLQNCGTVSVYMVKDSTTYTTISKIYSSSANVTLAYIGADSIPVISTWGDSTTSRGTDGLAWPSRLQNEITTHNIKNMAISGEFTTSTSCRQGGNQAHVKTAFTIPATCTEVEVELESKDKQTFSNSPVLSTGCNYNPVTISNIEGSISCKNNKYYFTRYKEGNEVQVNANTEVISKTSEVRKNDDVMIIYLGTNSGWNDTPSKLLAQIQSMVDYYQGTKYIITTGATGYRLRNESTRAITTEVETLFTNTFGEHYFSLRQYLIDNSLTENNLTATDVDKSRIALGQVPSSILMGASDLNAGKAGGDGVDDTHYNTYGLESVKNAFKSKLISLGYITIS